MDASPAARPPDELSPATVAVTAGRPRPAANEPLSVPVVLTSTFLSSPGDPQPGDLGYGRWGNPTWQAFESALGRLEGHEAGALVAVDNTFATPLLQRPLDHGADVTVHSVTKYLAGHSDVLLGAAVTRDAGLRERLHRHRTTHGAIPGTVEAWLALRGL